MYCYAAEQFILSNGCDHTELESQQLRDIINRAFGGLIARAQGGHDIADSDLVIMLNQVSDLCG
jgi:hypothetical protein